MQKTNLTVQCTTCKHGLKHWVSKFQQVPSYVLKPIKPEVAFAGRSLILEETGSNIISRFGMVIVS